MIYKLITSQSKMEAVLIDQDDFDKLSENQGNARLIRLKQAIINPSFIVAILPTQASVRKTEGYIDEKRGVYVVTKDETVSELADKFQVHENLLEDGHA